MTSTNVNGKLRKSLAEQIDRLDSNLDGMAEGLQGAVADAALRHLKDLPNPRAVYLDRTKVGDAGQKELHAFPTLEEVLANDTAVTEAGARALWQALPKCEVRAGRGGP
jgi:hypothetical protein